jgi:hypothetical protein
MQVDRKTSDQALEIAHIGLAFGFVKLISIRCGVYKAWLEPHPVAHYSTTNRQHEALHTSRSRYGSIVRDCSHHLHLAERRRSR